MIKQDILEAIRCCREGNCMECPLMGDICDDMRVDMVDLPEELVDLIEEALESK